MKFRLAICTAMSLALSFGVVLPGQADRLSWLARHRDGQYKVRRLRVQERLSDTRGCRRFARPAEIQSSR